jgi:rhodanese-related sulfurtransferase
LIPQLSPADVLRWRADDARQSPLLVDVREPWEFAYCSIDGSVSVPLGEVLRRQAELPRDRPLVMVCHHGRRSQHAAMLLAGAGFPAVFNLEGGVEAWATDVDPGMQRY